MDKLTNRKAAVNGRFYPANKVQLISDLDVYFKKYQKTNISGSIQAIIVPHAGYVFSGEVAASAYIQIDAEKEYENIFILAPSHSYSIPGSSIYNIGKFETPLGEVVVNIELANKLIAENDVFKSLPEMHIQEHSIEVQLPFLQFLLKKKLQIVPILIGTHDEEYLKLIAESLHPYFNEQNLFVISSDFSHFPNYKDAIVADKRISDAIENKKVGGLLKAVEQNKQAHFDNFATSACGISGILVLLHLIENRSEIAIRKIKYMNSGDSKFGDHARVVGYLSFIVHTIKLEKVEFELSDEDKSILLRIAREAIKNRLCSNWEDNVENLTFSDNLKGNCGVFVSLHKKSELRGCIGRFESMEPLYILCQKMAIASAYNDHRFSPLTFDELDDINIEISVLSPLKKIKSIDEIVIGEHGIYIKQGINKGTLLPQVAVNNNWNVEEFLGYCAKNKAGIGWYGWKTAEIYTFTAIVFSE